MQWWVSIRPYFFMSHSNFGFVPYTGGDNFPTNNYLFTIGTFSIGHEDCKQICHTTKMNVDVQKKIRKLLITSAPTILTAVVIYGLFFEFLAVSSEQSHQFGSFRKFMTS